MFETDRHSVGKKSRQLRWHSWSSLFTTSNYNFSKVTFENLVLENSLISSVMKSHAIRIKKNALPAQNMTAVPLHFCYIRLWICSAYRLQTSFAEAVGTGRKNGHDSAQAALIACLPPVFPRHSFVANCHDANWHSLCGSRWQIWWQGSRLSVLALNTVTRVKQKVLVYRQTSPRSEFMRIWCQ